MSRLWPLLTLLPLLALSACQDFRFGSADAALAPRDAGAPLADAPPRPDADPSCRVWRHVHAPILSATLLETEPVTLDRAARLEVTVGQCPGDRPGFWDVSWTLENEFLALRTTAWRSGPDCEAPEPVVRYVTATFPYAGTWTLVTAGEPLVLDVEPGGGACGSAPASDCERDCDCAPTERCLSGSSQGEPVKRCARPCEFDRECGGGDCGDYGGLRRVCSSTADECGPQDACPEGFECQQGSCAPTFFLSSATRHDCSCDSDCDPGLRCVALQNGDETTTSCQVPCATRNGAFCQGAHTCDPAATVEPDFGVCGWVGE